MASGPGRLGRALEVAELRATTLPLRAAIRSELERIASPETPAADLDRASRRIAGLAMAHLADAVAELAKVV